jgi:hypothetical protein
LQKKKPNDPVRLRGSEKEILNLSVSKMSLSCQKVTKDYSENLTVKQLPLRFFSFLEEKHLNSSNVFVFFFLYFFFWLRNFLNVDCNLNVAFVLDEELIFGLKEFFLWWCLVEAQWQRQFASSNVGV